MDVKTESRAGVALVAKAFQILDLFQADTPTWSQAKIVRTTGQGRSTVNRLVRYLSGAGYLVQVAGSGRYSLGLSAIELGSRASAGFDLRAHCQPAMETLAAQTHETVVLSAFDPVNRTAVCIFQIEGRQAGLRVFERIGSTFPLHGGAAPKAILGFLSDPLRAEIVAGPLRRFTDHTLTDPDALRADIEATRDRGYALSRQETYEGTVGIAAPILGPQGTAIASIAIALPLHRGPDAVQRDIGGLLCAATAKLSASLAGAAA
jgi:IclR family acetate operon transcriptional repressor